jgi:hypothetical protein
MKDDLQYSIRADLGSFILDIRFSTSLFILDRWFDFTGTASPGRKRAAAEVEA